MAQSQFSPHTGFNPSPLVRLLGSLEIDADVDSAQTLAESLGQWVPWTDAISLSAVLGNEAGLRTDAPAAQDVSRANALAMQDIVRVRKELTDAIAQDPMFAIDKPHPPANLPARIAQDIADLPILRRHYQGYQRTMEERIADLRARVRKAASMASPALRRLAALDAVLDHALAAQQRRWLATVPVLLEKRFKTWAKAARLQEPRPDDSMATLETDTKPRVGPTMKSALLAELDIRLQPVDGMMDAIGNIPPSATTP